MPQSDYAEAMVADVMRQAGYDRFVPVAEFFVPGTPQPGGSKRAFQQPKTGRIIVTEDAARSKEWRSLVAILGREAYRLQPISDPLMLTITIVRARPKSHYGTGRNANVVKPSAPVFPTTRPDVTKLVRSIEDALTGILWTDDALIVEQHARKGYGSQPGAHIRVSRFVKVAK